MKPFLHVAHITSPLKEGVNEDLFPKTVIVGPNGSGKSAVVDSLTLALVGRIFDVSGRDGFSSPAEVFSLVPPQFSDCTATATLSDGRQFVWSS
jgi:predicted ATP-dependent endonuclease of OLD family